MHHRLEQIAPSSSVSESVQFTITMYTTLHGLDSIRLLELVKYDKTESQLYGRLVTTRLRDRPRYYALSYVWGSKECSQSLLLGPNLAVPLGDNLFALLEGARIWCQHHRMGRPNMHQPRRRR